MRNKFDKYSTEVTIIMVSMILIIVSITLLWDGKDIKSKYFDQIATLTVEDPESEWKNTYSFTQADMEKPYPPQVFTYNTKKVGASASQGYEWVLVSQQCTESDVCVLPDKRVLWEGEVESWILQIEPEPSSNTLTGMSVYSDDELQVANDSITVSDKINLELRNESLSNEGLKFLGSGVITVTNNLNSASERFIIMRIDEDHIVSVKTHATGGFVEFNENERITGIQGVIGFNIFHEQLVYIRSYSNAKFSISPNPELTISNKP